MMSLTQPSKVLFISTYPPRKCGIASFTQDLVNAIAEESVNNKGAIQICALDKEANKNLYGYPVSMVMDGHRLESCMAKADLINRDPSIKLLCLEHEFGLYGGESGEFVLGFLALVEKPFIVRFHTVLPATVAKRLTIVQKIGLLAEKIIVMTKHSARLLQDEYGLPAEKIIIIPHGTHGISLSGADELKRKYKLSGKKVLTTFGLLSPNKGIEKGILAMKEISTAFPDSIYVVLGQTHPNLLEQEGEKYRNYLQELIIENDLTKSVRLVNEYVPTQKLMEYLTLTDIYLFTSKDPDQAVSGTFLYAMSAGCPIISNSFVLAREMLNESTGFIIGPGKEHELAEKAILLLQNEQLRKQMGHNAFLRTRDTTWKKVVKQHIALFDEILTPHVPIPSSSNLSGQFIG
jgi:glycosyltransferase involved in cell wall biosynthesis